MSVCVTLIPGKPNSGDIDLLVCHPMFTSEATDKNKVPCVGDHVCVFWSYCIFDIEIL